jgi:leader peptidase (prepilin peptidase) / N-methyltransferase
VEPESTLALMVLPPYGWILVGVWGAMWGSFFNVCIHRLGLYESVVRPRSRCPSCGRTIGAGDNIPILSWLVLRGRCRGCRAPISARYPLVELLSLGLALAVYARFVDGGAGDATARLAHFFVYFAFAGTLLVLSGIDLDHQLIPDRVTYPAIPLFFACALLLRDVAPLELLLGAVIGYGLVALTAELAYWALGREGMGYGDAKLLMMVGALLGWRAVVVTFFGAPFFGLVILPAAHLLRRKRVLGVEVPYGPFLAAAALVYVFFGDQLLALLPLRG